MSRAKHRRQGSLALVLISTAGGLGGCAPEVADVSDLPVQVARAEYVVVDDCVRDWGSEGDCEATFNPEAMDGQGTASGNTGSSASSGGGSSFRSGSSGSAVRWLGPYFSRSGVVYRYDGRVELMRQLPPGAVHARSQSLSPRQIYAAPSGRYATTAAHPDAAMVKPGAAQAARGRGGFGGTGRTMASAGG
ncbi:hypothetical protein [Aquabacterium sp. OR-4]|uniref:hypothetical protein n=1 Tax=Aquabacterium sp. OR-4 TaxID=2978127 RepID=UPI0021B22F05|nr:hypothetical protein [Aquabacterium sp. OR-4]MDT7835541.1 hypothetical protein [Aquabacterium sp. OR-4]